MKRHFLVPAVFLLSSLLVCLASCKKNAHPRAMTVLGTVCSVNVFEDGSEKLYDEIFLLLQKIESEFSVHIESSDVSRVNALAGIEAAPVCDDVFFVLEKALRYAEISGGDFDPTVGPLVLLWGIGTENARVPLQEEIDSVLPLVNFRNVVLEKNESGEKTVFLMQKGMSLDLGGIAKGFAADELVYLLKKRKVRRAVINLGGNVYVFGKKSDKSAWRIGIKNPFDSEGEPLLVLSVDGGMSVVTSGGYERFFESGGKRYHHIINPHTGYPAKSDVSGATIVCPSSCDADALSTIAFIQGTKKIRPLLKALDAYHNKPEFARFILISENGDVTSSESLSVHAR